MKTATISKIPGRKANAEVARHPAHFAEDRQALIREAAYYSAARRGFAPGRELEDWLAAEAEVDQRLYGEGRPY